MDWTPQSDDSPPMSATISQATDWMENHIFNGKHCPVCECWTQAYTWSLRDTWVEVLRQVAHDPDEWVALAKYSKTNVQNSALLRHWGLIQREEGRRKDGFKSTGKYRVTDIGLQFLRGETSVPRKVQTFDSTFMGFSDENDRVYVHEVLGYQFNFDAFMRGEG